MEPETILDNLEIENEAGYIKYELCSFHMDLFHDVLFVCLFVCLFWFVVSLDIKYIYIYVVWSGNIILLVQKLVS